MSDSPLEIDIKEEGATVRIAVRGDVTASRAGDLEDRVLPVLDGPATRIELDLSGMLFLSSTGVAILLRLFRRARQGQREFAVLNPTPHIERMLRIANLPVG